MDGGRDLVAELHGESGVAERKNSGILLGMVFGQVNKGAGGMGNVQWLMVNG